MSDTPRTDAAAVSREYIAREMDIYSHKFVLADHMRDVERELAAAQAQRDKLVEPEPVAWRTFDGEGGYDYRSYEDNESYADDWDKRNPNHKGWVDKLYTHSQRTWVGLTDEEFKKVCWESGGDGITGGREEALRAMEALLKDKNK